MKSANEARGEGALVARALQPVQFRQTFARTVANMQHMHGASQVGDGVEDQVLAIDEAPKPDANHSIELVSLEAIGHLVQGTNLSEQALIPTHRRIWSPSRDVLIDSVSVRLCRSLHDDAVDCVWP